MLRVWVCVFLLCFSVKSELCLTCVSLSYHSLLSLSLCPDLGSPLWSVSLSTSVSFCLMCALSGFSNGMLLPPSLPASTHTCTFVCRFMRVCARRGRCPLSLSPQPEHSRVPRLHGLGRRRALILLFLTPPPSQVPLHLCPSLPRRPAHTPAQASPHAAAERARLETVD